MHVFQEGENGNDDEDGDVVMQCKNTVVKCMHPSTDDDNNNSNNKNTDIDDT